MREKAMPVGFEPLGHLPLQAATERVAKRLFGEEWQEVALISPFDNDVWNKLQTRHELILKSYFGLRQLLHAGYVRAILVDAEGKEWQFPKRIWGISDQKKMLNILASNEVSFQDGHIEVAGNIYVNQSDIDACLYVAMSSRSTTHKNLDITSAQSLQTAYARAGRPSMKNFFQDEIRRRCEAGTVERSLGAEAKAILELAREADPQKCPKQLKTVKKHISQIHKEYWRHNKGADAS